MQTATATTCAELYDCDPTFAAGIAAWVADRRCPVALGDFLADLGWESAADCARWASEEADRDIYRPLGGSMKKCGVFPVTESTLIPFYWCTVKEYSKVLHCNVILLQQLRGDFDARPYCADDPVPHLLWLLDNFRHRAEGNA